MRPAPRGAGRAFWVLVHRWLGLTLAAFLLLAGLTGSLLAWYDELEAAISPTLWQASPPAVDAGLLDPLVLRAQVAARYPDAQVLNVHLAAEPGRSAWFFVESRPDPVTGQAPELPNDQVFVNPYTGEVLGERKAGDISRGLTNLMVFVYRLHYSLALGTVGSYVMGIVALLWTADCFIGAYLSFPARRREAPRPPGKSWFARWWPAWKLRRDGSAYQFRFDLHRASGLWPWAMLVVLAWSSVAFNLPAVYQPVMRSLFPHQPVDETSRGHTERREPRLGWQAALARARALMAARAQAQGFTVRGEYMLFYDPDRALYLYDVNSSRDIRRQRGDTRLVFDADSGAFKSLHLPTGAASGDTLHTWLAGLHMAAPWGWPFKLFVCAMGLVVAMLSVTGVYVWWQKRQARLKAQARQQNGASLAPAAKR